MGKKNTAVDDAHNLRYDIRFIIVTRRRICDYHRKSATRITMTNTDKPKSLWTKKYLNALQAFKALLGADPFLTFLSF